MRNLESKLQENCIKWFDYSYPKLRQLLFAIPNGGARNVITGAMLKRQGVRKGIPDLFLAVPKWQKIHESYIHGLFIEMKFGKRKLTQEQKDFFFAAEINNYSCEMISDFDSFKKLITEYLK
jgi:hypothetical protein